jgi:DNA primase
MPRFFTDELLRRLRNDVAFATLFEQLHWPHKTRNGQLAFLCPKCGEYASAVNPRTNLARCFWCRTNFNHIEFVMHALECDFVDAVHYLDDDTLLKTSRPRLP